MPTHRTLIGFGASSMAGAGDPAGGFFRRIDPILSSRYRLLNLGVGGDATADMLRRAGDAQAEADRDVIVLLGCNDMPRDNDKYPQNRLPIEAYSSNLQTLLPQIRGERSLFVSSFPVSPSKAGVMPETFDQYMQEAMRIATQSGYETWDLYQVLRDQPIDHLLAPDGVHFNGLGHQLIADGVLAKISAWPTR